MPAFANMYISQSYVSLVAHSSASVAQEFLLPVAFDISGFVCQSPHPPDVCSDLCSPLTLLRRMDVIDVHRKKVFCKNWVQ